MIIIEASKDGYLNIHEAEIYYRIYGSMDNENTVLLIHGNGEDWTCFQRQIEPLSRCYKVITMDSRGHGRSMCSSPSITLKQIAKDAASLLHQLKVTHAVLIGFSDGANIAMEMALSRSLRIDRLILIGGNLYPYGVKMRYQLPDIFGYYICALISKFDKKALHSSSILRLMVKEPHILPDSLEKITAPTLVICGEHDMIKSSHTQLISRSIPNSRLETIPGASHFVLGKWADKTNEVMMDFLRK